MGSGAPPSAPPTWTGAPCAEGGGPAAAERFEMSFWGAVAGAPPATNRLIVDLHELAFAAWVRVPAGGLRLRHHFPHARSVAWSLYHPVTLSPLQALRDHELVPDAGSTNPFLPGADRTAARRAYTVTVSRHETGEPNTLSSGGLPLALLFYRLYVPDCGTGRLGGTGVPRPVGEIRAASPVARAARAAATAVTWRVTSVGLSPPYLALRALHGRGATRPAVRDPRWDAFFNVARTLVEPQVRGTRLAPLAAWLPRGARGPAKDWATDSALAFTDIDRRLGPDADGRNVLVIRGRMPRTPRTWNGNAVMDGDVDLRYWSLCSMTALPLGVTTASLFDEQVPLDGGRRYTIVVSTAADRPRTATREHGVAWLCWPARGDGYGRLTAGTLGLRNQDPAPRFGHAIQDVPTSGAESATMGPYLPRGVYVSADEFDATAGAA